MSTKDDILSRIRSHTGTRYEKPEITLDAITYADKLKQFSDSLEAAGGQAVVWQPGDDINELIRRHFPEAKRIGSNLPGITVATFNPDSLSDPRKLNDTDLAIVEGCFGVAENGAVWITQQVKFKALYFIPTALVIIINTCMKPTGSWKVPIINTASLSPARPKQPTSNRPWCWEPMDR